MDCVIVLRPHAGGGVRQDIEGGGETTELLKASPFGPPKERTVDPGRFVFLHRNLI